MITGDGKSGDQICGRKLGYTNVACISRKCDCPQAECDDTNQVCQSIQSENVRLLVERALSDNRNDARAARKKLDAMTQHVCDLAPFQLSFGGDPTGVFGCTPVHMMHAFLEGILKYALVAFFHPLSGKIKADIDVAVDELLMNL